MRSLKILANIAKYENPEIFQSWGKTATLSDKEKERVYQLFTDRSLAKPYGKYDRTEQEIFEIVYDRLYWPGTDLLK